MEDKNFKIEIENVPCKQANKYNRKWKGIF